MTPIHPSEASDEVPLAFQMVIILFLNLIICKNITYHIRVHHIPALKCYLLKILMTQIGVDPIFTARFLLLLAANNLYCGWYCQLK